MFCTGSLFPLAYKYAVLLTVRPITICTPVIVGFKDAGFCNELNVYV